jgi:hypothetical protein
MEDSGSRESIYHVLCRFICDSTNQDKLFDQCNIDPVTARTNHPFQLRNEPRYASLLEDLGEHWLPPDLIDLYFDWPLFTRVCTKTLVPAIRYFLSSDEVPSCPLNEQADFFDFVLWILERAAQSEAEGLTALERRELEMPLGYVQEFIQMTIEGDPESGVKPESDVALGKLVATPGAKQFFRAGGPANAKELYAG